MRLAERLIQQQDAAVSSASALRASIPEQGRILTFKRSVAVDKEADLRIGLRAVSVKIASGKTRAAVLFAALIFLAVASWMAKPLLANQQLPERM